MDNNELNPTNTGSSSTSESAPKCCQGRGGCRSNLHSYNWLDDIPGGMNDEELVEVHFKNTRRGFYRNSAGLDLHAGDMVAVEANPGHDIGRVALTGKLVRQQMKRVNLKPNTEILRVFRKAKPTDLERFEEAKAKEVDTMIRSRKIAVDLGLKMKIGDVEYQGDGNKAIFYYIADERVDFRQLIKVLADVFKIRVEMKQIGARQEAGRIGGIGPCGRPLCCASWMMSFVSVATSAARFQDISLNPQKLAGQCAKLKCCINYEVDAYLEASRKMPPKEVVLETKDKQYFHFKADVLKREVSYSTEKGVPENLVTISAERVFEVMALNRNGVKPDTLALTESERDIEKRAFGDILGQDAINRFDKKKKKKNKKNRDNKAAAQDQPRPNAESQNDGSQHQKPDMPPRHSRHEARRQCGGQRRGGFDNNSRNRSRRQNDVDDNNHNGNQRKD